MKIIITALLAALVSLTTTSFWTVQKPKAIITQPPSPTIRLPFFTQHPVLLPVLIEEKNDPAFRIFTPNEFFTLYDSTNFPNTQSITTVPLILNHQEAHEYIMNYAFKRRYSLRVEPINKLENIGGHLLQPQTKEAWLELKQAARQEGIILDLISAHRSVSTQLSLFRTRFQQASKNAIDREYTPSEILQGDADKTLDLVLKASSVPGTSRHHSGYAIDITDTTSGKNFTEFEHTPGYVWISEDNFYNAKRFGFIPSYPIGGTNMGPDPEAWEYVWVGVDVLTK